MEILGNKLRGDRRSKDLPRIPDSLESSGMLAATLGSDFFLATINSHLIKIPITRKQEREREREREVEVECASNDASKVARYRCHFCES